MKEGGRGREAEAERKRREKLCFAEENIYDQKVIYIIHAVSTSCGNVLLQTATLYGFPVYAMRILYFSFLGGTRSYPV